MDVPPPRGASMLLPAEIGEHSGVPSRIPVPSDPGASRVPEPDAAFWGTKVVTTAVGETLSDFLVRAFAPELVVPAALLLLLLALALQLRARRYGPVRYWATALAVSVFGTMAADVLHVGLGVPYAVSTIAFAAVLAAVLVGWWRTEGTLSVHLVTTDRRERFYWATVLATFALGTAAGDLTATSLGLGYLASGVLFAAAFAVPGVVHLGTGRAPVATFWTAYVLTRPLGASFADWFAVPPDRGGVGLGAGPVSAALLAVLVALIGGLALRGRRSVLSPSGSLGR